MTISRDSFYAHVRASLFHRGLAESAVVGMNAILDAWEAAGDIRHLAYDFATAYHETAYTMTPVRELGLGRGRPYGYAEPPYGQVYYGRGFVQLTWETNYEKAGTLVKENLVEFPDKALDPPTAAKILVIGMEQGLFTGLGLSSFINSSRCDFYDARRCVNGVDSATEIAQYANSFLQALTAG